MSEVQPLFNKNHSVTQNEVKAAIRTILAWIGEDINREGLKDTPKRLLKSYKELFMGYQIDPASLLTKTFSNSYNYQDFILLKDIKFISMCEHHMLPIIGVVHIAYIPDKKIVGISKLARVVEILSKRLQIQENLTLYNNHLMLKG
jgi:GTP cyclohydrolase I